MPVPLTWVITVLINTGLIYCTGSVIKHETCSKNTVHSRLPKGKRDLQHSLQISVYPSLNHNTLSDQERATVPYHFTNESVHDTPSREEGHTALSLLFSDPDENQRSDKNQLH